MKYCDKCTVHIGGDREYCPLCQNPLSLVKENSGNEVDGEIFPYIPTLYKQHNLFLKIIIFLSIVAVVVTVTVNMVFQKYGWWSLFVVSGVGCLWILLYVAVYKRKNIPKNIMYETVLLSSACIFWDWLVGWHGWSLDYALPIICLSAMLAMVFIGKIMDLDAGDYLIYLFIGGLFGVTPVLFVLFSLLNNPIMSLVCVAASIIFLSGVMIFQGNSIIPELKKRLHL